MPANRTRVTTRETPSRLKRTPREQWEAAVYGRRSMVRGKADTVGVEKQIEYGADRAQAIGFARVHVYKDDLGHRSGRFEHTRPDWMRLKEDAARNSRMTHLIVHKFERASRSVKDTAALIEACSEMGMAIVSLEDDIDTSTGWKRGDLQRILLKAVFAQDESDEASERQRENVTYRKSQGVYWGCTPFGSVRVGQGTAAVMRANPPHDATVRKLCELYAQGLSFDAIKRELDNAGYLHLDRRGNLVPFRLGAVQSIAWNVLFYAGYLVVDRRWHSKHSKVELSGEGTLLEQYARAMGAVRSPKIEQIISDELACSVLASRLHRRRTGRSLSEPRALLTPMAWTVGGYKLRAQSYGATFVYRTRTSPSLVYPVQPIDDELMTHLRGVMWPETFRHKLKRMEDERNQDAEAARKRERISVLTTTLAELRRMRAEGYYRSALDEWQALYQKAEAEIMSLNESLARPTNVAQLIQTFGALGEVIERLPIARRKRAIQHLFDRIEIGADGRIARIIPAPPVRDAFGLVIEAMHHYQERPRQDLSNDLVSLFWFADRVIVTS